MHNDEEHAAICIPVHIGPHQIVKTKGLFPEVSYKICILYMYTLFLEQ